MPHSHNLRTGRTGTPGGTDVCSTVALNREPHFAELALGRIVVNAVRTMDARGVTHTLAFVVMPDQLHWLFVLGAGGRLANPMQYVKQRSAYRINMATGRRGTLWQPGFHDHAVRSDESVREIARCIVFNPVRAGLVRSVREYALWDAMWL